MNTSDVNINQQVKGITKLFDSFMGSCTSLIHKCKTIGVDKEQCYVDIALNRIKDLQDNRLKRRPFGKPIYEPIVK